MLCPLFWKYWKCDRCSDGLEIMHCTIEGWSTLPLSRCVHSTLHMQHCTQHQLSAKCQYIFPPWRMLYLVLFMCLWARQSRGCSLTFHNATCSQWAGPEFLQCHVELCSAMQRYAVQSNNCSMDSYSGLKGSPVRTGRLYKESPRGAASGLRRFNFFRLQTSLLSLFLVQMG